MQRISPSCSPPSHLHVHRGPSKQACAGNPIRVTSDRKQAQTGHRSARIVYISVITNLSLPKTHNESTERETCPALPSGRMSTSPHVHATSRNAWHLEPPDPSQPANRVESPPGNSIPWHASNTASLVGRPNGRCARHLRPIASTKFLGIRTTNRAILGTSISFCACNRHEVSQATPKCADRCPTAPSKGTRVLLG